MTQHAGLTEERWAGFELGRQLMMIANEMHRASGAIESRRIESARLAYERVLRLLDLTVRVQPRRTLRRELLRWRDLVAALYVADEPDPVRHRAAFRIFLQLNPETARQIPYVLG